MDFNSALNRLIWRFEEFDRIVVNENDIEAINKIVDYMNALKQQNVSDNIHFSKLYAFSIGVMMDKYDTTIDEPLIHKELHKLLKSSFISILTNLTEKTNDKYRFRLAEIANLNDSKHPKPSQLRIFESLINSPEKASHLFDGVWSINEVELGIINQVNNFLEWDLIK